MIYGICPPKQPRQLSTADSESNIDGSMHVIQCTGTDPDGKGCVAWISIWLPQRIPRNFIDRPFVRGFCTASGFEECKRSPPSKNADNTN